MHRMIHRADRTARLLPNVQVNPGVSVADLPSEEQSVSVADLPSEEQSVSVAAPHNEEQSVSVADLLSREVSVADLHSRGVSVHVSCRRSLPLLIATATG